MLDPFPTKLLIFHLSYILDIILCIVNLCFSPGVFTTPCKSSVIFPLIKKQDLDLEILKNYRLVANLSFILKIIEKASTTALLRVYNDIVTTIGRCNCAMLVLLDLSAAFDTIDYDNLFCILETCV